MDSRPAPPKFASFKPKSRDPPASSEPLVSNQDSQVDKSRRVPKFASFNKEPEGSSKSSLSDAAKTLEKDHSKDGRDHKSHDQRRSRHTKSTSHHRRHERHRSRSAERSLSPAPVKQAPKEEPLFITDKRGDSLIVRYGSNERSKVPAYRRYGSGRVLGATGRLRLIYDGPKQIFSLGGKLGEGPSAFRDRNILANASRKKVRVFRLRSAPGRDQTELNEDWCDYIPMSGSRKRKRTSAEPEDASEDDGPNYRSIQGKAKARDFVDSDLESADTSDSETEPAVDTSDPARQKSVELSRRVKDHPEDVDAWLDLVDLQEVLLRLDQHTRQERSDDEVKGLASIRVSLLEEALPHVSDRKGREKLILRLMREGSRAWGSKTLTKRWSEISREDDSFAVWKSHLNHKLSNMTNFSYDEVKGLHFERLHLLRQRLAKIELSPANSHPSVEICNELVYVFLRTTRFIHDAGYSELAVAAWQAILELTFARPRDASDLEVEDLMSSFGDFWESEVPRIGEDDAKGWIHFAEAEEMADLPESRPDATGVPPDTRDVYKAWAALEKHRSTGARLPARTLDEGTEDDPFRVVMFSDLKPLLLYLPPAVLTSMKEPLLDAFLLFNRCLPASKAPSDVIQEMLRDPFIHGNMFAIEEMSSKEHCDAEEIGKRRPRFTHPNHRMALSTEGLFAWDEWFNYIEQTPSSEAGFVLKATKQLALNFEFDCVGEYSLALARQQDPSAVKKAAKALLKRYPSKTRLYNAYAIAEWGQGNQDVARKVLLSATSQDLSHKQLLWNTFAWLELEVGNKHKALALCVLSTEDRSMVDRLLDTDPIIAPSQLLKTRQVLSSNRDFLLSSGDLSQASEFAQTLSLFEYLSAETSTEPMSSQQGSIPAAISSISAFTSEAVSRGHGSSADLERFLQFAAHILYLHTCRGPFRPPFVRDQLHSFLELFPSNTIFLNLFAWADTSLLLNDPVREALRSLVLREPHDRVSSRVFAILHELDAGTVHSARAAFEAALDSDSCRGSAGLWRSYVRFCQQNRKELKGKSVEVYYRAVNACPWSKELAMEAFTTLVKDMDSADLRGVFATMTAKGLRVHVDLEDFSKEWARSSRKKD
ncbi:hypothetical protein J7T55_007502 [Diaporthe amygdali]|uniref:uncharacterized protein n=1 Tax=Phomopsis amygdali TaxID=1214568 RepID=UPI0022FF2CC5|nr:uncharacterized protein J7T55_007502 [Diaporthe amygdali]KAJ0116522.1 hypothetical protein J7T55_007502 [Diaporthe amygdali]